VQHVLKPKEMQTLKRCFLAIEILKTTPSLSSQYSNWLKNTHGRRKDANFAAKKETFDEIQTNTLKDLSESEVKKIAPNAPQSS
jgi:hypothetical protein